MTLMDTPASSTTSRPANARYQIKDRTLEHQLDTRWVPGTNKQLVQAVCNCRWVGIHRQPDHPEPTLNVLAMVAEYEGHLASG